MIVRRGWASIVVLSLALSPMSTAQEDDQQPPSDATSETTRDSESEPGPDEAVEQVNESSTGSDTTGPEESSDGDDTDVGDQSGPLQGEPAAEVFVPTEEISEDFAVPFPVDI